LVGIPSAYYPATAGRSDILQGPKWITSIASVHRFMWPKDIPGRRLIFSGQAHRRAIMQVMGKDAFEKERFVWIREKTRPLVEWFSTWSLLFWIVLSVVIIALFVTWSLGRWLGGD
jgi:hypothetical protein